MNSYRAFGLRFRSDVELPAGVDGGAADVRVRRVAAGRGRRRPARWRGPRACFGHPQVGTFLVRDGSEIVVRPVPDADEDAVRLHVIGPATALVLSQRGDLVMHACAASCNGRAALFVGPSGSGKSTLAAALQADGWGVLDDDLAVVRDGAVWPGWRGIKLCPDALGHAGIGAAPRVHRSSPKRWIGCDVETVRTGVPIARVYLLGFGPRVHVRPVAGTQALRVLLGEVYGAHVAVRGAPQRYFQQCAALVAGAPVRRLERPRDLAQLADVVACVRRDIGA